jgi:excisionase family DNA binding protein
MTEKTSMDRLMTVEQAAAALALRPSTVRKLLTHGHLRRVHPTGARAVRIRLSEVTALIDHGRDSDTAKGGA